LNRRISKEAERKDGSSRRKIFLETVDSKLRSSSGLSFRSRLFSSRWEQPQGDLRVMYRVGRRNLFGLETSHLAVSLTP
jgi:hypothetical protein